MSSCTSNSDLNRRYVLALLSIVSVAGACMAGIAIYLQPLFGDLTRIGFYSERDFGWNKPQLEFHKPLSDIGNYESYHDVVVLGDSFSTTRPRLQWQNYLVATKGWSIVTLDINKTTVEQVLENPNYRNTPPKYFILETVERYLPRRIEKLPTCADVTPVSKFDAGGTKPPSLVKQIELGGLGGLAGNAEREAPWREISLGYVRDYIRKNFRRWLVGDAETEVAKLELIREAPFSSNINNSILVYVDDLRKMPAWHKIGTAEISCRVTQLRNIIEINRKTQFVFMAAPDKLTAYEDFVLDTKLAVLSTLTELSDRLPDVMPRIDLALAEAIRKGEQDVYLPDDTHWGSSGYQIAAETLLAFLGSPAIKPNESPNDSNGHNQ